MRRRQPPRRSSQTLAHPPTRRLPHGVRLLVHGLRNCRRPRRKNGQPKTRSLRHGRRRLVPDDGPGNRHFPSGRIQTQHRPPGQSRFLQHRRPQPRLRQRRHGHKLPLSSRRKIRRRRHPRGFRRQRRQPRCLDHSSQNARRIPQRPRRRPQTGTHLRRCRGNFLRRPRPRIAEVSERESVRTARNKYEEARKKERYFF